MVFTAIFAGFVIGVVHSSFFEWTFHRYWLHRPYKPEGFYTAHALVHHQLCKFEDTFHVVEEEQREAMTFNWWSGPMLVLVNTIPWALLSWGLWALGVSLPYVAFVAAFSATVTLYYITYESSHYLMHKPSIPFIERTRWFKFIKRHHQIHHARMDRNLNVVLPLADVLLRTIVREATVPPITSETSRQRARRHSSFGRRLRAELEERERAT